MELKKLLVLIFAIATVVVQSKITTERVKIAYTILDRYMSQPTKELFKVYHFIFEKGYSLNSEEAIKRYKIFKNSLTFINEHNSKNYSWTVGLNKFSDMTKEEFRSFNTLKPLTPIDSVEEGSSKSFLSYFDEMADKEENETSNNNVNKDDDDNDDIFPFPHDGIDVNHKESLSKNKDQLNCGSCWAFTAITVLEAANNIARNNTLTEPLSTQQLVDCDTQSSGCNGGWMPWAFDYLVGAGSILDSEYTYKAEDGKCEDKDHSVAVKISGHEGCSPNYFKNYKPCKTLERWAKYLSYSPVGVAIDTETPGFQNYRSGVIDLTKYNYNCPQLTHAITAYALTTKGKKVYISLRNSWGADWGDNGDFHIYYHKKYNSTCWITNIASRPIIKE